MQPPTTLPTTITTILKKLNTITLPTPPNDSTSFKKSIKTSPKSTIPLRRNSTIGKSTPNSPPLTSSKKTKIMQLIFKNPQSHSPKVLSRVQFLPKSKTLFLSISLHQAPKKAKSSIAKPLSKTLSSERLWERESSESFTRQSTNKLIRYLP